MAGKIKNPAASFVLKQTDKKHGIKQRAKLQASLAFCSFLFMHSTLMRKISARACDFLGGCLPLLAVNGSAAGSPDGSIGVEKQ